MTDFIEGVDYYVDPDGLYVFTEAYLRKRGFCCRQGCRHCPYGYRRRMRASAVVVHDGKLLVVRLREPGTKALLAFPPGGAVEEGEPPARAAERETLEEAGYRVRARPETETVRRYPFTWDGMELDVTTYFYVAELTDAKPEPRPSGSVPFLEKVEWIALAEVEREFAFHPTLSEAMLTLTNSQKISSLSPTFEEDP